jgi:16S rRNA (guanine966-N2)-methyltransferase
VRIVAGRHRGLKLATPADNAIRPTSDRAREALFNILAHRLAFADAIVLDLFCGTGALGLEALSRGAAQAIFVDTRVEALELARRNVAAARETLRATFLRHDATQMPPARLRAGLVFLDPPYRQGMITPTLGSLASRSWLAPDAVVVAECEAREVFELPAGYESFDERRYGRARLVFLHWAQAADRR